MHAKLFTPFRPLCPYETCSLELRDSALLSEGPKTRPIVRYGRFRRANDSRLISRFRCMSCRRTFSNATRSPCFGQKKRTINSTVESLLASNMSQRRIALVLGINLKTVARKLLFLAAQAKRERLNYIEQLKSREQPLHSFQFDEMETFERSKCLPLSIPLVVLAGSRKILGFRVCEMPANGPLAAISKRKYGKRKDERAQAARALLAEIQAVFAEKVKITTDQNPKYPGWLKLHFPKAQHETFKGRRGCVVGQGELKKIGFDPLFSLNHTCAMLRYGINRLARRTWSTTKKRECLEAHLELYIHFHNRRLTG